MKLSLYRAGLKVGVRRKKIRQAIEAGNLKAQKNKKGHYEIESSDLLNLYPKKYKKLGKIKRIFNIVNILSKIFK